MISRSEGVGLGKRVAWHGSTCAFLQRKKEICKALLDLGILAKGAGWEASIFYLLLIFLLADVLDIAVAIIGKPVTVPRLDMSLFPIMRPAAVLLTYHTILGLVMFISSMASGTLERFEQQSVQVQHSTLSTSINDSTARTNIKCAA